MERTTADEGQGVALVSQAVRAVLAAPMTGVFLALGATVLTVRSLLELTQRTRNGRASARNPDRVNAGPKPRSG